ncbi:ATP-binding SpoIIE family protein phosphatase [Streptomyces sp. NPDC048507]|uniref:ATP-binding SpoIIE family protein phosphatase n=1 Tax=Streptomyces sp. NPDC048507 TaxID=3365560 RepID=UPI00371BE762
MNAPHHLRPLLTDCEDITWFRDQPEAARGAAAALGRRIALGEHRTGQLVLAVAELATNTAKHAVDGSLLLRVLRTPDVAGVEVLAVDNGPGMPDVTDALRDGMSTKGTLGIGLGAVQRLADTFAIHSQPGIGTVQLARFWPHPPPEAAKAEPAVAGITRALGGQDVCGDAWAVRADTGEDSAAEPAGDRRRERSDDLSGAPLSWSALTATRPATPRPPSPEPTGVSRRIPLVRAATLGPGRSILVMACDGLGHGPMAALAAQAAVQAFRTGAARSPEQAMEQIHRSLRGTRGAAVAVARIEPDGRVLFCGVGNITAALVTATNRTTLFSHPGIVGHQMSRLRTLENHLPARGALVMHSDGLSERWTAADLAPLLHHPPALIAAGLLRHAGTRRDDASVVIAKGGW